MLANRSVGLMLLLSVACTETVDSSDVRTGGVFPEIEVTADGSGTSIVNVELKVGGASSNTFLELRGSDELRVRVGDTTKTMRESGNGYVANFPEDAEGTEFEISFQRGDDDESAPSSMVALPAPFELALGAREFSRADDDVEFSWSNDGSEDVGWAIKGDCIQKDDGATPDDGEGTLAKGTIDTFESDKDESCSVELQLTREQYGELDDAFEKGGRIVARHVRTKSFTSTP